jgi:hypothetical protein
MTYKPTPAESRMLRQRARETGRTLDEMVAVFVRMTSPGVAIIGDEVVGDAEAEAGGFTPLTGQRWPPPGARPFKPPTK